MFVCEYASPLLLHRRLNDSGLHDFSNYFDAIARRTPCCLSDKFSFMNTVDFAWTDAGQQQKVREYALQVSGAGASSKVVKDTILVISPLDGQTAFGWCTSIRFTSTTDWVAISGPMIGSMGSAYLLKNCASNGTMDLLASLLVPTKPQSHWPTRANRTLPIHWIPPVRAHKLRTASTSLPPCAATTT